MTRGDPSGYSLDRSNAPVVLGMQARGDRDHDIAAWFGVNQGRVAEVKDGRYANIEASPEESLPPKGPPGIKGRRIRKATEKALGSLSKDDTNSAKKILQEAIDIYDANET